MDIKSPVAEARNDYTYSADGKKLKVFQKWNPNYSTTPVLGSAVTVDSLTQTKTTDYAGNKIYENEVLKRTLIEGGYIEGDKYYYYLTDHLGNNRVVATGTNTVTQKNHYYPFGMTFGEVANTEQGVQPYKYNGKELDRTHGLNWYDYSARHYDGAYGRFTTPDPLAEKKPWLTLYHYCSNNPVSRVDPSGMSDQVYIDGLQAENATKQLNNSTSLNITRNSKTGKLSATGDAKTKKDKQLLKAINSENVSVNIIANDDKLVNGMLTVGGSFLGNEIKTKTVTIDMGFEDAVGNIAHDISRTTVKTKQLVNPKVLGNLDSANNNTLGTGMLHEVLESYEGGVISLKSGVSSPPAGQNGSAYNKAHNRAPRQGGVVSGIYWDAVGNILPDARGAVRAEIMSNGVIIMKYP